MKSTSKFPPESTWIRVVMVNGKVNHHPLVAACETGIFVEGTDLDINPSASQNMFIPWCQIVQMGWGE